MLSCWKGKNKQKREKKIWQSFGNMSVEKPERLLGF